MLILYTKPTCPFSHRVLDAAEEMGIELQLKDTAADPALRDELIARGGKKQVPYLVDEKEGIEMYESMNIITHLKNNYVHKGLCHS